MNPDLATCFKTLGLPHTASLQDVKKARRSFAQKWHPDKFHSNPKLYKAHEEKFKQINIACDILVDAICNGRPIEPIQETAESKKRHEEEERQRAKDKANEEEEHREKAKQEATRNAKRKEKERTRHLRDIFLKFQKLAKSRVPEAQYRLAMLYRNGHGCVQNKAEAFRLFKKAAAGGDSRAILYFGFAYAWGIGVSIDTLKAIQSYQTAVEKGLAEANFHLGFMYYFGIGVKQDFEIAAKYCLKATKEGYKTSEHIADSCGHLRTEISKDCLNRYKWYVIGVNCAKFQ